MKKIVLLLVLAVAVLSGCLDISANNNLSNSGTNGGTGNSSDGGNSGETDIPAVKSFIVGSNTLDYDNTKQLHTLIYRAGDKNGLHTDKSAYTLSSDNNLFAKENIYSKKAAAKPLSAKEIINEANIKFQLYAENAGLKPIEKNDNVMYKTAPQTVEVGTKWNNVYVQDIDNGTFKTINATCIAVSNHAYFFLEDGLTKPTEDKIQAITEAFDKDYEIIHQYYGEETDTDGNGKVSFMIYDFSEGIFGFFYTADKFLNSDISASDIPAEEKVKSNESDVLYINHKFFADENWTKYSTDVKATFIHEFQHMVLFDSRSRAGLSPNIARWINEGLSMLSEYYGNYGAPHYNYIASYFNKEQGKSLIHTDADLSYGLSYLFLRYLQIRFGDDVVKKIYASNKDGTQMIEEATGMDFDELYTDFITMILVTGRGITTDKRYNIEEFNGIDGSEIYNRNGFNLSQIIDERYSYNAANPLFITNTGNSRELPLYGFQITKWSSQPQTLTLQGDTKTKGLYNAW